jgi:glycosyltransferase involved in cell wall biosynthesis
VIFYTAAHGGFSREGVPLGGGAAVFDHLVKEWTLRQPFVFRGITPSILGVDAPSGRDLVSFSARDYGRFCRDFEHAATEEILRHDPASTIVLSNDISEGPDFAALAARGYRVFTIFHVDVVAYVSAIYLRGRIAPETTVRWHRRFRHILPSIARLIWEKQEACVRYSRGLIVPSEGMREVLLRCYPDCPSDKIHVLPWGAFDVRAAEMGAPVSPEALRAEFGVPRDAQVLLTLSRISPEKGQDLLLESLLDFSPKNGDPGLWLFICGDPAFMQGRRFLDQLRHLASRLRHIRVVFPGHVTGDRKRAFFALADLYVFPSRHESYGLTLMEALAAGLPVVCLDSLGARDIVREDFGVIVRPDELRTTFDRLLADADLRHRMGHAARAFAAQHRFADQAEKLAKLLDN